MTIEGSLLCYTHDLSLSRSGIEPRSPAYEANVTAAVKSVNDDIKIYLYNKISTGNREIEKA